jgi:hypothetical protein
MTYSQHIAASRTLTLAATSSILFALQLFASSSAHAYDLSRQDSPSGDDKVERGFVDVQGGLWLPGWDTFNDNHDTSFQLGAEFGVKVFAANDHHFFVVGGATFSPQTLAPHLSERDADMILAFVGVRYIPGALCAARGVGCLFIELGLGLTWETVDEEFGHTPPDGELTFTAGVGYRFRLGRFFTLGARIDLAYLEESYESQIGWITPTAFLGASF